MNAKQKLVLAACSLILSAGIADAGPCNQTTGTGNGEQTTNRAAQVEQRQEHAQPSVAQQPQSTGRAAEASADPSAKMTDPDRTRSGINADGSETSVKMADQGC